MAKISTLACGLAATAVLTTACDSTPKQSTVQPTTQPTPTPTHLVVERTDMFPQNKVIEAGRLLGDPLLDMAYDAISDPAKYLGTDPEIQQGEITVEYTPIAGAFSQVNIKFDAGDLIPETTLRSISHLGFGTIGLNTQTARLSHTAQAILVAKEGCHIALFPEHAQLARQTYTALGDYVPPGFSDTAFFANMSSSESFHVLWDAGGFWCILPALANNQDHPVLSKEISRGFLHPAYSNLSLPDSIQILVNNGYLVRKIEGYQWQEDLSPVNPDLLDLLTDMYFGKKVNLRGLLGQ